MDRVSATASFWIGWGCGVGGMLLGEAVSVFVRIRRIKREWR